MIGRLATAALLLCLMVGPSDARVTLTEAWLDAAHTEMVTTGRTPGQRWRYRGRDDPSWNHPAMDDGGWEEVLLDLDNGIPDWEGIGWFRLQVRLDGDKPSRLALRIFQLGATEVYLNGRLLEGVGKVGKTPDDAVESFRLSSPKIVPFVLEPGTHTLAIRHCNWWGQTYKTILSAFAIQGQVMMVGILRYDQAVSSTYDIVKRLTTIQMLWGVPFALALIHYFIYMFNRDDKAHLDYGLFAESIAGMTVFPFQSGWVSSIWWVIAVYALFKCSLVCSALFGLRFAHRAFDEEVPHYHRYARWLIYSLCAASLFIPLSVYYAVTLVGFGAMAAIVFRALWRRRAGALIVALGIVGLTVSCTIQVLMEFDVIARSFSFPYIYGVIFLTMTMSIHLARTYARTHENLAFQIEQVEALTEVTLQQDRETREREAQVRQRDAEHEVLEAERALRSQELSEERERRRVLEELESSSRDLRSAQSRLVQTERMAAIGNLVAGIAHEINTPVGAIHSSHDTLVRAVERHKSGLSEEGAARSAQALRVIGEANRVIATATSRVTEIVRSLRNFARLDEAEMKRANVHEGLDSTLTLVHHYLKNRISVNKEYGDLPEIVCFPSRLNQVFLNILTNASQAIEGEGTITIRTTADGDGVTVAISDTGRGIDETDLPHIFQSGFTTKAAGEGTGLGLAISKQIVDDHQGTIEVESVKGEGTTFRIFLPRG